MGKAYGRFTDRWGDWVRIKWEDHTFDCVAHVGVAPQSSDGDPWHSLAMVREGIGIYLIQTCNR